MAMNPAVLHFFHQMACGAIAAAGFGVLFNVRFQLLPWCAVFGALALGVRTGCQDMGWNLEGASFAASLAAGVAVQLLRVARPDISQNALAVVGCIPMVPGSFAAKAILGLYALTIGASNDAATLTTAVQYTLRVSFIIGAIGTGLAIPTLMLRVKMMR
jgi:uncharacterized membrane protein YjjB (DUF3815 family)